MIYHILPINDVEPHEELTTCHCKPVAELLENGDIMCTHNSFDGREGLELANEVYNQPPIEGREEEKK